MTTATLAAGNRTVDTETVRPRRSLEELVDQLFAAMGFADETEVETVETTPTRSIHEARRLRQAGDVDGALGVLGGADMGKAEPRQARWAFSEWKGLVRRRFGGLGALVYSQGTGRAAALVPHGDGTLEVAAVLGMRWRPGKVVSERSLRGLRPLGRRRVMVAANVDIPALKARHPLGDTVEAAGVRLRGRGRVRQGVCPFHEEAEGSFTVYRLGAVLLLRLRPGRRRPGLHPAGRGAEPAGGHRAAGRGPRARFPGYPTYRSVTTFEDRRVAPKGPRSADGGGALLRRRAPAFIRSAGYLASRGVGPVAAARLGLGYAPGGGLRQALESLGFSEKRIRDSGLFMERGAERFAGMVVVPDPVSSTGQATGGLVRWLAGRALDTGAKPRFQALPGPKPVLGLGRLGPAPPWAVVAEGLFDWLALTGWGLPACAALGTQGVERVASALRGCPRVFLAFDGDDAGREATERLLTLLGRRAAAVALPPGVGDVGELAALPHGRTAFVRLLSQAARSAR